MMSDSLLWDHPDIRRLRIEREAMLAVLRGFSKMHSGLLAGDPRAPMLADSMARTAGAVVETFDRQEDNNGRSSTDGGEVQPAELQRLS